MDQWYWAGREPGFQLMSPKFQLVIMSGCAVIHGRAGIDQWYCSGVVWCGGSGGAEVVPCPAPCVLFVALAAGGKELPGVQDRGLVGQLT